MRTAATPGSGARVLGLAGFLALLGSLLAQPDPKPAARGEETIALPTVTVSGDTRPWLYGSLPGFEILTRASNERSHRLLLLYLRSWLIENEVIPGEWIRESPVPCTIIIDETEPETPNELMGAPALSQAKNYDVFGWTLAGYNFPRTIAQKVTPLKGWIHAADEDTSVLGANVYATPQIISPTLCAPTWLDRLDRCAPGLPRWMTAGLVGPCGVFAGRTEIVVTKIYSTDPSSAPPSVAMFRGLRWISTFDSKRLRDDFSRRGDIAEIPFIPLQEFFSESPIPPPRIALWESEAGLLVRWGLLGTSRFGRGRRVDPERRAQFTRFVERQRTEAVTESMLLECFGLGYAALEQELKAFLKETLGQEFQLKMAVLDGFRPIEFKPATPDQVGRIIGDWQRMQGASLQECEPAKAKEFFHAADRTLSRAWLRNSEWLPAPGDPAGKKDLAAIIAASQVSVAGNPDPDFLAVCGLYEFDIGEYKLARDVLEIAVALRTRRPKAYFVLAELRAREATAQAASRNGTLTVAQATYVLQPLKTALASASSLGPWRLMVDTLARCERTPSVANLDVVINGAALFPRDASLQLATARLCLRAGERETAMGVITKSLPLVVDDAVRKEFYALRDSITKR